MGKSQNLPIDVAPDIIHAQPGNLNARIQDGRLILPNEVVVAFAPQRLRGSEELLSFVEGFPSAAAAVLNWSIPEVRQSTEQLRTLLGHSKQESNPRFDRPTLGALDPDLLKP